MQCDKKSNDPVNMYTHMFTKYHSSVYSWSLNMERTPKYLIGLMNSKFSIVNIGTFS